MRQVFQPEWRTQNRLKRRFYARYMAWLERIGYVVVLGVVAAFLFAFNYRVDDLISADAVKLQPNSTGIKATSSTLVVRAYKHDFDDVKAGEALLEVVEGDEAIKQYGQWERVDALRRESGPSAALDSLAALHPKPATRMVSAPVGGTFRYDEKATSFDADSELCRVADYRDIRLSASLSGDTVGKASVGQFARITNLDLGSTTGTLVRANTADGTILTTQIIGDRLKAELAKRLKGSAVQFRDDVPLSISDVTEVQVDASVQAAAASGSDPAPQAPPPTLALRAEVLEGEPAASAQIADLPADISQSLTEIVRSGMNGKVVKGLGGSSIKLTQPEGIRFLVKLKAKDQAPMGAAQLSGTPVKRTFEATLKVESPPDWLIDALREADRSGKDVTARVELRTGTRPIAFILLKKS